MPKIPVNDDGYYTFDSWDDVLSFKYTETKEAYKSFVGSGLTIYERMAMRYREQIPLDFWMLEVEDWKEDESFITITRYWGRAGHFRFVPKSLQTP